MFLFLILIISYVQAIKSLCDVVSGDVQSISTLRGMAKASSPGLISGLALWAADSYRSASHSARAAPFATSTSKLQQYAEFKAVFFRAYALTFAGKSPSTQIPFSQRVLKHWTSEHHVPRPSYENQVKTICVSMPLSGKTFLQ